MSWSKAFPVLLAAGILSLLIPLTLALAQGGGGTVNIMDGDSLSDKASISIMDLPALPGGQVYEGWFVTNPGEGDRKESTGILKMDADGMIEQTFMLMSDEEATGENLFAAFDRFVVTIEPDPDDDPGPSDQVALIYIMPEGNITHIRHLLFSWQGNPEYTSGFHEGTPKGIVVGLREQSGVALLHANLAADSSNLADVQQHAEHLIHILEGSAGADVGDGFGVLNYASDAGDHAGLAVTGAPQSGMIAMHADEVMESANQVVMWGEQARDLALRVMNVDDFDAARLLAGNAVAILERSLNGFDANGNGVIERISGEGGAKQAYMAAQAMGAYALAEVVVEVEPTPEPPKTGDVIGGSSYAGMALVTVVIGAFLLMGGLFAFRLARSSRSY